MYDIQGVFVWRRASSLGRPGPNKRAEFHFSFTWEFSGPSSKAGISKPSRRDLGLSIVRFRLGRVVLFSCKRWQILQGISPGREICFMFCETNSFNSLGLGSIIDVYRVSCEKQQFAGMDIGETRRNFHEIHISLPNVWPGRLFWGFVRYLYYNIKL